MTVAPFDPDSALAELIAEAVAADPSAAALLARDDLGWARLDGLDGDGAIGRDVLLRESRRARVMRLADPLIRRASSLRTSYVFGQGVHIGAKQEEGAEQDLNAVIQSFLDDPSNVETFSSQQALEEREAALQTDGERFTALPTNPRTGRVQVRTIPHHEVVDVICDPEDGSTPWFYKREWSAIVTETGYSGLTRTRRELRRVLYPALGFRPKQRPKSVDGIPVQWDTPVLHTAVNRTEGSRWGVPDLLAALPWAVGYREFLQDWARLIKALSRFAFKATSKSRSQTQVRSSLAAAPAGPDGVGSTIGLVEGQKFEAIGKSGATIDSESGRPLAAMVAAAVGVPVTMLLGDPGVTGARATAETLDKPLENDIRARQSLHAHLIRQVLDYVIDQAIKAPQGPLKGTVRVDPYTGVEEVALAGDQLRGIEVTFPSLSKVPVETLVKAVVEADGTDKLPPLTVARLLLVALDVEDVDEVLAELVDDDGNFVYPDDAAAARSQQNAIAAGIPPGTGQQPPPEPADQPEPPPAE